MSNLTICTRVATLACYDVLHGSSSGEWETMSFVYATKAELKLMHTENFIQHQNEANSWKLPEKKY